MKERPILFSASMVRAILSGSKTQTRRVIKPQPASVEYWLHGKPSDSQEGLPTMRNAEGVGWSMCGPYKCPFIGDNMVASKNGKLVNSRTDDHSDRKSLLWVRETWNLFDEGGVDWPKGNGLPKECPDGWHVVTAADAPEDTAKVFPFRPSIHMPRWASRITLEVTSVCVERLQEISEEDAKAEGVSSYEPKQGHYRSGFKEIWNSINGAESWETNPWVWVIEFDRLEAEA